MSGRIRLFAAALAAALCLSLAAPVWAEDAPENGTPAPAEDAAPETPSIVDPFRYYDYAQMTADLAALAARYPDLVSVSSIGKSVEGRDIPVLRLGRGSRSVLVCAAIHAREFETTAFAMYMAEQYCRGYEADANLDGLSYRQMLDGVTFVIVPQLNPDGVDLAQRGDEAAAERPGLEGMPFRDGWMRRYYAWKSNIRGVDLNRNWPYLWNNWDKCAAPASADYAGPEPLSEPETQAMMGLIQATPFWAFCSFHSAGNCIYWIDSSNSPALYDKLYPTARRIADYTGYRLLPAENVSRFGGYMINYCRAVYEKPCMTVEIGAYAARYPFSSYDALRDTAQRAYPICLILADEVLHMPESEAPAAQAPAGDALPAEGGTPAAEDETPSGHVSVELDGELVAFPDVTPFIENGRTLTPLRAVCEAAGLTVDWNGGTVTVTDGETAAALTLGDPVITVNGVPGAALEAAPRIVMDRTLIPIRALMEAFGYDVGWEEATRRVVITTREY